MRSKKAIINSSINIISFLVVFMPNMVLRKVFLNTLGNDMLGLNSLYSNIIGWLSIIEMGVGTAIIYSLYKPFATNDKEKIRAYIRFYGIFYKRIGIFILIVGSIISPFIGFFINGEINIRIAILGFFIYLINSVLSYLFTHRLCILNVAQEAYKVTLGMTISKIIIVFLQLILLKVYPNFILYGLIQILVNLVYYIIINLYITISYPWLDNGPGELEVEERKTLLKNVKAMFMHKIGSLVVLSTDNIVISKFIGLTELAKYTNYYMIIDALQSIVSKGLNGVTATIGNLLTDGDKDRAYDVHKKIFFINFWVVSFIVISLYNTLNQFIGLWVGTKYFLNYSAYVMLLFNLYFSAMRGSVERFQEGSGNYRQDRYAPLCEAIINLGTSIFLVRKIGITGVFVGTFISNIMVIFWTKPYVVYKYVFDRKLIEYFKMYFRYLVIAVIPLIVTSYMTKNIKKNFDVGSFISNCFINIVIINIIYFIIFFRSEEFKYFLNIIIKTVKKKNKVCAE